MRVAVLLRHKELPIRRTGCCCSLCELMVPVVLVGLLIIGNVYAGEEVGREVSYAPANRLTALQTINPLNFLDGIISGGVLGPGPSGGGGGGSSSNATSNDAGPNSTSSVFATPEKGGMVLPLELWMLYNHIYNDALGGLGAELGALNLGNVLPSDAVAVVPANNSRVRALINDTFAPYRVLASSFGALLSVAQTIAAGEPLLPPFNASDLESFDTSSLGPWEGLSGLLSGLETGSGTEELGEAGAVGAALSGLLAQLQQLVPSDELGLSPDELLSRGLVSAGANPTLSLLSKLGAPTLSEVYFETEEELDRRVELGDSVWAAIVFEEVPEEGAVDQSWRYAPYLLVVSMAV